MCVYIWGIPGGLAVKNPPAMQETRVEIFPGSGRSSGGGHGNPLQYSCLENPMDRGAWGAKVHRAAKSWTRLKPLSTDACTHRWFLTLSAFPLDMADI